MSATNDLAIRLADLQRRLTAMERSSQGRYRSIEAGAMRVYDADGNEVLTIGAQPDGSYQIVGSNGGKVVADDVVQSIKDTLTTADGSVTAAKLAAGAVTETKIADGAISTPKLIAGAVQTLNLAAGAVAADTIAANAVTAGKIAALAVTAETLAANAVTADKIAANSITAGKLASILVLATRLLAGDPLAERVELNSDGLFAFDDEGSATFSIANNSPDFISVRNGGETTASISQNGDISGASLNVDSITVGGDELALTNDNKAQGAISYCNLTPSDPMYPFPTTTSEVGLLELGADLRANRLYRVSTSDLLLTKTTADGGALGLRLRYTTDGTKPLITDSIAGYTYATSDYQGGYEDAQLNKIISVGTDAEWRFLFCLYTTGGGTASVYENTTNTFLIEDLGPRPVETGVKNNGGVVVNPPPAKKTYTKSYTADWVRSYNGSGNYMSDQDTANQGYYSSERGNQRSMIGFPGTVKTDLTGATVNKIEIYLYFQHWYSNAGGTAVIGCHGAENPVSTSSGTASIFTSAKWPKPGGRWVTLPSSTYDEWKSGAWCGILLGPGDSTSGTYYGKANGITGSYKPTLRVTYTK